MNKDERDKLAYEVTGNLEFGAYSRVLRPEFLEEYLDSYGEEGFEFAKTVVAEKVVTTVINIAEGKCPEGIMFVIVEEKDDFGLVAIRNDGAVRGDYQQALAIHFRKFPKGTEARIAAVGSLPSDAAPALTDGAL